MIFVVEIFSKNIIKYNLNNQVIMMKPYQVITFSRFLKVILNKNIKNIPIFNRNNVKIYS